MSRIIAVLNQKGGVGKTTTVVNLSHGLALSGKSVLAVDLDPQSNLSAASGFLFFEEDELVRATDLDFKTIYDVLKGEVKPEECIVRVKDFFLLPGSLKLAAADLEFGGVVGRELMLKRALSSLEYDFIIIDCPPNLGILSVNALAAATDVLIPVQSEFLALFGVKQLIDTIEQVKQIYNPGLRIMGVLITMVDRRKRLSRAVIESVQNYFGDLVFNTCISENVALAEAPARAMTIFEYAPKSQGAQDFMDLVNEVLYGKEIRVSAESS